MIVYGVWHSTEMYNLVSRWTEPITPCAELDRQSLIMNINTAKWEYDCEARTATEGAE